MTPGTYLAYEDSGIEWVGGLPSGWRRQPFFAAVRERREKNVGLREDNLLSLSYGNIVRKDMNSNDGLLPESFETYQIVRPSDIVFRFTDLQNDKRSLRSALVGETGIITSAYLAVTPVLHNPRYFAHLMRSYDAQKVFYSMGGGLRQSMKFDDVKHLPVVTPSLPEQEQIADYLDVHTAKIDALIGKQERLIQTLAERRQAVISHAVTKGLDPNAPMTDSGVEWLGLVPRDWNVTQVKKYFHVTLGKMLDAGRAEKAGDELLPYIRAANIQERGLDLADVNAMPFTPKERDSLSLRKSDLLVVEGGAVGVGVMLDEDMPGWSFQKTVNRVRARGRNSTAFLGYFLDAIRLGGVIDMLCNKSTIAHFTAEKLNAVEIALPPADQQTAIVGYLDRETAQIDALSAKAREMIDVLKERRQALISAAVTGKIDVRGLS